MSAEGVDASKRGLPRPILKGLPAPYSGDNRTHGLPDDERTAECLEKDICTICGEGFAGAEKIFTACHVNNPDILLDQGHLMHERCAKIALAHCPHMRHGFSLVFWVTLDELSSSKTERETSRKVWDEVEGRRLVLGSTSQGPNTEQPWRPSNEDWPAPAEG